MLFQEGQHVRFYHEIDKTYYSGIINQYLDNERYKIEITSEYPTNSSFIWLHADQIFKDYLNFYNNLIKLL